VSDKTQEELEQEREQEEAERAFAAGFSGEPQGEQPPSGDGDDGQEGAADPQDAGSTNEGHEGAAGQESPPDDPLARISASLEALHKRVDQVDGNTRATSGRVSALQSAIEKGNAASVRAGTDAPSGEQIAQALHDPDAFKQLKEDFPDFAGPVEREFAAIRADLAKLSKPAEQQQVNVEEIEQRATQKALRTFREETVEDAHPGWRESVKSKEFKDWLPKQSEDVKALAASDRPRDAIKLLNVYAEHYRKAARNQRRLEAAVSPKGAAPVTKSGISDEEAFMRGFNNG